MKDTRRQILKKNFEAMHEHGFQGLRTDQVIRELGVTKGAFYHYFSGKKELGYCVVEEILSPHYVGHWSQLYQYKGHPIEGIIDRLISLQREIPEEGIKLGCALNNLIQEMSPLDEGFRQRLSRIVDAMQQAIRDAIERGQKANLVDPHAEAAQVALFVVSSLEGAFSIAKVKQSRQPFDLAVRELSSYLRQLKSG